MDEKYVYKKSLSNYYGLTPKMIEKLCEPDELADNPYYPSGPRACLYRKDRVKTWIRENQAWVNEARARRAKRRQMCFASLESGKSLRSG